MHGEISWQVELSIEPEQLGAFRLLTSQMIQSTRLEQGVLVYERFLSEDHGKVFVYERYSDSEAAIAHLHVFREKFGKVFSRLAQRDRFLVFGRPNQQLRQILSGFGAEFLSPMGGFSAATTA